MISNAQQPTEPEEKSINQKNTFIKISSAKAMLQVESYYRKDALYEDV